MFEHPFHMLDDLSQEPVLEAESQPELGTASVPQQAHALPQRAIADDFGNDGLDLTFFATELPESSFFDILKQNDW